MGGLIPFWRTSHEDHCADSGQQTPRNHHHRPGDSVLVALEVLAAYNIGALPVVSDGQVVGIFITDCP